jgi:hypothetical protein
MLLQFARIRKLRRSIWVIPVMTSKLSSYWLYFITSTSYRLAVNLVDSMKIEVICQENNLQELVPIDLLSYKEALELAFGRIEQQEIISSWTDARSSHTLEEGITELIQIPSHGCFTDRRMVLVDETDQVLERIFAIGGNQGWYYANWLWEIRGFIDKLVGGVGLGRPRGLWGRVYWYALLPLHTIIFRSMIKRIAPTNRAERASICRSQ